MKDFDSWNRRKKKIDNRKKNILPSKRQIWWTSVGLNIGDEEDGKNSNFERPVLVVKVFNRNIFLGVPMTSTRKSGKYYFSVKYNDNNYYLILSQIKLFSTKRLLRKIWKIQPDIFRKIKRQLKEIIEL